MPDGIIGTLHEIDEIGVSFPHLEDVAGTLEQILKDLTQALNDLFTRVASVAKHWKGEAREAFLKLAADWDRQMQDLEAVQRWLHHVVTNGHTNYANAHRAVLRGWGAA